MCVVKKFPTDKTVNRNIAIQLMPSTHSRRRCDGTVELSRVGGVYWALGPYRPPQSPACLKRKTVPHLGRYTIAVNTNSRQKLN